jgi:hypothetical protein
MAIDKNVYWTLAPTTDPGNHHQINSTSGDVVFGYDSAKLVNLAQYIELERQLRQRLIGAGFK